jgi:hypothetical protein
MPSTPFFAMYPFGQSGGIRFTVLTFFYRHVGTASPPQRPPPAGAPALTSSGVPQACNSACMCGLNGTTSSPSYEPVGK